MITLEQAREYIEQLNLDYIIQAMCAPSYPLPKWTIANATKCCRLYKNFLILQKKHFPAGMVPTREIDEFWHNHILHTKKYLHDCTQIFGHYLHHEPAAPDGDNQGLADAYLQTKEYYLLEFKQPLGLI